MSDSWGGKWTDLKLAVLGKYYQAFQTALKRQGFRTWYVDALAGDGKGSVAVNLPLFHDDEDIREEIRSGSAALALQALPPFHAYRLNEINTKKASALRTETRRYSVDAGCIDVSSDDANAFVLKVLGEMNSRTDRGIILLDPFGMQVSWRTIAAIADKGERDGVWLDLWYLFPTMAVVRMLPKKGLPIPQWQDRLDEALGTQNWRTEFYVRKKPDLFVQESDAVDRLASFDSVEAFVVKRLANTFPGGIVIDEPLRLGPVGKPIFSLCFASGNPSKAAQKLIRNLATDILSANQPRLL